MTTRVTGAVAAREVVWRSRLSGDGEARGRLEEFLTLQTVTTDYRLSHAVPYWHLEELLAVEAARLVEDVQMRRGALLRIHRHPDRFKFARRHQLRRQLCVPASRGHVDTLGRAQSRRVHSSSFN